MTTHVIPLLYGRPIALTPWADAALPEDDTRILSLGVASPGALRNLRHHTEALLDRISSDAGANWTKLMPVSVLDADHRPLPAEALSSAEGTAIIMLASGLSPFKDPEGNIKPRSCWTRVLTDLWRQGGQSARLSEEKGRIMVTRTCAFIAPTRPSALPPFGVYTLEADSILDETGAATVEARAEAMRRDGTLKKAVCLPVAVPMTESAHQSIAIHRAAVADLERWARAHQRSGGIMHVGGNKTALRAAEFILEDPIG